MKQIRRNNNNNNRTLFRPKEILIQIINLFMTNHYYNRKKESRIKVYLIKYLVINDI